MTEGLIDFGIREIVPYETLAEELIALVAEDAQALQALAEVENMRGIVQTGNSASQQRGVYARARETGRDHQDAMRAVVAHLIDEFHADL